MAETGYKIPELTKGLIKIRIQGMLFGNTLPVSCVLHDHKYQILTEILIPDDICNTLFDINSTTVYTVIKNNNNYSGAIAEFFIGQIDYDEECNTYNDLPVSPINGMKYLIKNNVTDHQNTKDWVYQYDVNKQRWIPIGKKLDWLLNDDVCFINFYCDGVSHIQSIFSSDWSEEISVVNYSDTSIGEIYQLTNIKNGNATCYAQDINNEITDYGWLGNFAQNLFVWFKYIAVQNLEDLESDNFKDFSEIFETRKNYWNSTKVDKYLYIPNFNEKSTVVDSQFYIRKWTDTNGKLYPWYKNLLFGWEYIKMMSYNNLLKYNNNKSIFSIYQPNLINQPGDYKEGSVPIDQLIQNNESHLFYNTTDASEKKSYKIYYDKENHKLCVWSAKWEDYTIPPSLDKYSFLWETSISNLNNIILDLQGGGGPGEKGRNGIKYRATSGVVCAGGGGGGFLRLYINMNWINTITQALTVTLTQISLRDPSNRSTQQFSDTQESFIRNGVYSYLTIGNKDYRVEHGFSYNRETGQLPYGGKVYLYTNQKYYKNITQHDDVFLKTMFVANGKGSWAILEGGEIVGTETKYDFDTIKLPSFNNSKGYVNLLDTNDNRGRQGTTGESDEYEYGPSAVTYDRIIEVYGGAGGGASILGSGYNGKNSYQVKSTMNITDYNQEYNSGNFGGGGGGNIAAFKQPSNVSSELNWGNGSYGQPACFILHW